MHGKNVLMPLRGDCSYVLRGFLRDGRVDVAISIGRWPVLAVAVVRALRAHVDEPTVEMGRRGRLLVPRSVEEFDVTIRVRMRDRGALASDSAERQGDRIGAGVSAAELATMVSGHLLDP